MKEKHFPKTSKKKSNRDMLESFSPWTSVGKVLPTSTKPKENVFDSYRPKKVQCLDYKISEIFTKMQAGDIKINFRQTTATYEKIPEEICKHKKRKKVKHFHGGPPKWKFVDEIWREHMEEVQKELRIEHKKVRHELAVTTHRKYAKAHDIVQRLVGPEWFMELSPKQLSAVEKLNQSINEDLRDGTTVNTQEVMATLGLVLRPSRRHVQIALRHSCRSPVEFLLVLYQIIDLKRECYSLNDRLLLSAVVHLTITETLRELHVRIPSPPREIQDIKKPKKNLVKKKYKSPYLEPLTYEPPPPKYTGIYKNKHRQYPESPYFSYLPYFDFEKKCHSFFFNFSLLRENDEEKKRMQEYLAAMEFFQSLSGGKDGPDLIPPKMVPVCQNLLHRDSPEMRKKFTLPRLCKIDDSDKEECCCKELLEEKKKKHLKGNGRSCCEKHATEVLEKMCFCDDCLEEESQKNTVRIHGGLKKLQCKCDGTVAVVQGTLLNKTCECYKDFRNKLVALQARQKLEDAEDKHVISSVIMTKLGPVYNISSTIAKRVCRCEDVRQKKLWLRSIKDNLIRSKASYVVGGVTMTTDGPVYMLSVVLARKPCECVDKYRNQLAILEKQNELRKNDIKFVIGGMINSKVGPVFILSGVLAYREHNVEQSEACPCDIKKPRCLEHCEDFAEYRISRHELKESSEESSSEESFSDTSSSEDDSSSEESSNKDKKNTPKLCKYCTESTSHKTSSIETEDSLCSCKDSSDETVSKSTTSEEPLKPFCCKEELERFMKAKCPCEECNAKIRQSYATYIMSGIKTTPSGNQVSIVQGIQQPQCSCLHDHQKMLKKIEEYKARVKARYEMKKNSKKFFISGVRNTPEGPVYIISGLRPPVECDCAKAIKEKQTKEDEFAQMAKMPNTGRIKYEIAGVKAMPEENVYILSRALNISDCKCMEILKEFESAHKKCTDTLDSYLKRTEEEILNFEKDSSDPSTVLSLEQSSEENKEEYGDEKEDNENEAQEQKSDNKKQEPEVDVDTEDIKDETQKSSNSGSGSSEEDSCSCSDSTSEDSSSKGSSSECESCRIQNPMEVRPIRLPKDKDLPDSFLSKRFAIFKEFPKSRKMQLEILRHILEGMAEDGFPLAKLPHAYKLPIFKLWLEMRSRIYWTYDDRWQYYENSKALWRHTDLCYKEPPIASMPFTLRQANQMTWKHAKMIRRIAAEKMENYYRHIKQATVDTGREFFAPTYSYEFPTRAWRDCAFAYLPTKEEDLFPYKIVMPHDTRFIPEAKKFHCYC